VARARTLWEEGTEPGRKVVTVGSAVSFAVLLLDLALDGGAGLLYDLGFVLVCVAAALLVRPPDFFTIGVYPPLLMLGSFWLVALVSPGSIGHEQDGALQAVITGLAHHAGALVSGYGLCLACLAMRQKVLQSSNRAASPAPRRTTTGTRSE
jgi:hypothetical protein